MAERPKFQEQQYAFAAHIRDPQKAPPPEGIEDHRMAIYRELFFNNLKSLLSNMFPVLKKLHSDQHWNRLVRRFMQHHQAQTPYFLQLPAEFRAAVEAKGGSVVAQYWAVGDADGCVVFESPDEATATALLLGLSQQGNVRTKSLRVYTDQEFQGVLAKQ
mgnify:CR=1 FL=1